MEQGVPVRFEVCRAFESSIPGRLGRWNSDQQSLISMADLSNPNGALFAPHSNRTGQTSHYFLFAKRTTTAHVVAKIRRKTRETERTGHAHVGGAADEEFTVMRMSKTLVPRLNVPQDLVAKVGAAESASGG